MTSPLTSLRWRRLLARANSSIFGNHCEILFRSWEPAKSASDTLLDLFRESAAPKFERKLVLSGPPVACYCFCFAGYLYRVMTYVRYRPRINKNTADVRPQCVHWPRKEELPVSGQCKVH